MRYSGPLATRVNDRVAGRPLASQVDVGAVLSWNVTAVLIGEGRRRGGVVRERSDVRRGGVVVAGVVHRRTPRRPGRRSDARRRAASKPVVSPAMRPVSRDSRALVVGHQREGAVSSADERKMRPLGRSRRAQPREVHVPVVVVDIEVLAWYRRLGSRWPPESYVAGAAGGRARSRRRTSSPTSLSYFTQGAPFVGGPTSESRGLKSLPLTPKYAPTVVCLAAEGGPPRSLRRTRGAAVPAGSAPCVVPMSRTKKPTLPPCSVRGKPAPGSTTKRADTFGGSCRWRPPSCRSSRA